MEEGNKFIARQSAFFKYFLGAIFLAIFIGVIFTIKGQEKFTPADYIVFIAGFPVPAIGGRLSLVPSFGAFCRLLLFYPETPHHNSN